jgi:hypothetical protein
MDYTPGKKLKGWDRNADAFYNNLKGKFDLN